jgi:NAD(P)-dependent dehydrogenase (short-subunit alcohol dehydrogenase family)
VKTGLEDRIVVVTGATANIGRAIALAFAEEGARLALVGRDEAQGAAVVEEALSAGARDALWIAADVTIADDVARLSATVLDRFSGIDVLVNNVGGNMAVKPFAETDPVEWRFDIDVTLVSTLACTHAFLPAMLARGAGRIINIGSTAGIVGDPYLAVYSAAKAAVHGFTRVLAAEVGKAGITVNAIAPYATRPVDPAHVASSGSRYNPASGVFRVVDPRTAELLQSIRRPTLLPRDAAISTEIGAAAVYLASDHAAFITGETLAIDGGVRLA